MFIELFRHSPIFAIVWVLAILVTLTIHEFSHALVARWSGDTTAEREGRLTLNPIAHIDPMGFLLLLFVGFGWARPVPFNPYQLRNPVRDSVLIALAGPVSNLLLAGIMGLLFRAVVGGGMVSPTSLLSAFLLLGTFLNCVLALFNLIPLPPLDGSKLVEALLAHFRLRTLAEQFATVGPQLFFLLILASFFMNIPIFTFVGDIGFQACDSLLGTSCFTTFLNFLP